MNLDSVGSAEVDMFNPGRRLCVVPDGLFLTAHLLLQSQWRLRTALSAPADDILIQGEKHTVCLQGPTTDTSQVVI